MQFKTLSILSILSILFFSGCDSKGETEIKTENQNIENKKIEENKNIITYNLNTIDNKIVNISIEEGKVLVKEHKNKIVLLNFFATWCPPCKAEIPNLIELQNKYKDDFVIISVLLEENKSNQEISEFAREFNVNYVVTNDSKNYDLAKSLGGVKAIPTMFMIDKDSNTFQKYVGLVPLEMLEIDIKKALEK